MHLYLKRYVISDRPTYQSSLFILFLSSRDVTLLIKQISFVSAHLTFFPFRIFRLFGKFVEFLLSLIILSLLMDHIIWITDIFYLNLYYFLHSVPTFPIYWCLQIDVFLERNVILSLNFVSWEERKIESFLNQYYFCTSSVFFFEKQCRAFVSSLFFVEISIFRTPYSCLLRDLEII